MGAVGALAAAFGPLWSAECIFLPVDGAKSSFCEVQELWHLTDGWPGHLVHVFVPTNRRMTVLKLMRSLCADAVTGWTLDN